ncbi:recombinase [uncultured Bacteroides sp.]|jgi:pterin-4a-carbinolamine dehydratase|uniref:recombinase n=1 Tax=uncultured Bacteroides sp. TaxID=162156 RepID=UPI0025D108B8|nr:recombinase [uncultured Bacteroides sp.]
MGNLLDSLKKYFENTPKDVLDNDWKEIEYLNEIGPDVIEYADFVKKHFDIEVSFSNIRTDIETHKYDVKVNSMDNNIAVDAMYYFAA